MLCWELSLLNND